uniref:ATP synthesase subunit 9 n=3 Tax=Ceratocystis TaxID=5157 RepID=A0A5C1VC63_9PEZI|nr:ATP synthase subunit 9 [Ceratocystis cacaofunesta]YP_009704182.1 ATP synthesase subunit 9 [Ceratocystis fimbriata]YP_009710334.1 ATP synthesase subunit 9 [Ceratocystis albifundus]AFO38138.1 ATP synthase subunit 9 [Ceratocystis cacaofunesta]QEN73745.1 ATP synthesase subunit 9 [Ceratocystis fimbriata]QFX74836.1 ATP synthesase subunit 9 [Ceratocystis albifundus]
MIQVVKFIQIRLATTGLIGSGIEIGIVFGALILATTINPSLRSQLFSYVIFRFYFRSYRFICYNDGFFLLIYVV